MNRKSYDVTSLPAVIDIGNQTENGVLAIRVDCTGWRAFWPDLSIGIWVSLPGSAVVYPALTYMDGNVLVWKVNSYDTALAGEGTMEIVGFAAGQKKLSATVKTRIRATTTCSHTTPPDATQVWVDQVLRAAGDAEFAKTQAAACVKQSEGYAKQASDYVEQAKVLVDDGLFGGQSPDYYLSKGNLPTGRIKNIGTVTSWSDIVSALAPKMPSVVFHITTIAKEFFEPFTDYATGDFYCQYLGDETGNYGTLLVTTPRWGDKVWYIQTWAGEPSHAYPVYLTSKRYTLTAKNGYTLNDRMFVKQVGNVLYCNIYCTIPAGHPEGWHQIATFEPVTGFPSTTFRGSTSLTTNRDIQFLPGNGEILVYLPATDGTSTILAQTYVVM